jgi:hypothetical protein
VAGNEATGQTAVISQTLTTVAGQGYYISFWYAPQAAAGDQFMEVLWGGTALTGTALEPWVAIDGTGNVESTTPQIFTEASYYEVAPTTSTTLQIGMRDDASYILITDIQVDTPEPISMIFFGTGLVAVGGYMARRKMARKA